RKKFKKFKENDTKKNNESKDYNNISVPKNFTLSNRTAEELADQICIIDYNIFNNIKPRECLGQAWKKKDNKEKAPNILNMIEQFNNLTKFLQIYILREKSLKNRSKILQRII